MFATKITKKVDARSKTNVKLIKQSRTTEERSGVLKFTICPNPAIVRWGTVLKVSELFDLRELLDGFPKSDGPLFRARK
jgi:hypothetical protein